MSKIHFFIINGKNLTRCLNKKWFNLNNIHFLGFNSNFHEELLDTVTPHVNNYPTEGLNRFLKSQYDAGHIGKEACAHGIN